MPSWLANGQKKQKKCFGPPPQEESIKEAIEDAGFDAAILSIKLPINSAPTDIITRFRVGGMTCSACVSSVQNILTSLPGITSATVALATEIAEVEYDSITISAQGIVDAIEEAGFEGTELEKLERDKAVLIVQGMVSDDSAARVQSALMSLPGVTHAKADVALGRVEVTFDPDCTGLRFMIKAIASAGGEGELKASLPSPLGSFLPDRKAEVENVKRLFLISAVFGVSFCKLL